MKMILLILALAPSIASAKCIVRWVDHDFNAATPAVQQQICDRATDIQAIPKPSVRPIQRPQVKPIQSPMVPPVGTSRCALRSIYENGQWVTREVCQ
jgi:hypothetical protein